MKGQDLAPQPRHKRTGITLALATTLLAGCTSGSPHEAASASNTNLSPPSPDSTFVATGQALRDYRASVLSKHRADIALGSCVGWQNSRGITVTLNPGVAFATTSDGKDLSFFVFSAPDNSGRPDSITQMDGPELVTSPDGSQQGNLNQAMVLTFTPEGVISSSIHRAISSKPVHDTNGQVYYTDLESGLPVIDTALTDGPLSFDHVSAVCDALRNHLSLPSSTGATA